jgi:predicted phosphodiesterase
MSGSGENGFARSAMLAVATILASMSIAYVVITLASETEVEIGPVSIEFSIEPSLYGRSVVALPPAGTIEADTHAGPSQINFGLKEIAVDEVDDLTREGSPARMALEDWREPVEAGARSLILRLVIVAVLSAGAIAWLIQRSWRWLPAGCFAGLAVAFLLIALPWLTYDTSAFLEPRYSGSLADAPEVITFSQDVLANLELYGDQVPAIAESLYLTVNQLQQLPPSLAVEETIKIMHVSDLHASEAGAGLIQRVIDLYEIDLVIDTGDSTELGLPFEAGYLSYYLPVSVPYIWVGGNHDNPFITATMERIDGVIVMDDEFVTREGLTLGGFPDPAAASFSLSEFSEQAIRDDGELILQAVREASPVPFIVAVHNPMQAQLLPGRVPVVLAGHTHRESIEVVDGSVLLNSGSTGGGGLRSFEKEKELPSSLQILYVRRQPMKLIAVDSMEIFGFSQEFRAERRVFQPGEGEQMPNVETSGVAVDAGGDRY